MILEYHTNIKVRLEADNAFDLALYIASDECYLPSQAMQGLRDGLINESIAGPVHYSEDTELIDMELIAMSTCIIILRTIASGDMGIEVLGECDEDRYIAYKEALFGPE